MNDNTSHLSGGSGMSPRNLSQAAREKIESGLMSGVFRPGAKLTIRDLAANMGFSPTPVREALVQLAAEGALTQVAGRSFVVPELTVEGYEDLRRLRSLIEGDGAFRAAENATTALIDKLRGIHEQLEAAKAEENYKDALVWNQRFHLTLSGAAGSPRLQRIVEGLWLQMGPVLNVLYEHRNVPAANSRHGHLLVIDALISRDGDKARQAIQSDIGSSAETILTNIDSHLSGTTQGTS